MSRIKAILAAATFTGLVLITILALGTDSLNAQPAADAPNISATEAGSLAANGSPSDETVQAWQQYSAQLEQTVRILQQRDAAYQQQLQRANLTIVQLQQQIKNGNAQRSFRENETFELGKFDD